MAKPELLLWLSDARGQFIPRDFATSFSNRAKDVAGVDDETWAILEAGRPDHEWYWEAWDDVCNDAIITDDKAHVQYRVYQDGACWLVPVGMEWSDENEFFIWPEE